MDKTCIFFRELKTIGTQYCTIRLYLHDGNLECDWDSALNCKFVKINDKIEKEIAIKLNSLIPSATNSISIVYDSKKLNGLVFELNQDETII